MVPVPLFTGDDGTETKRLSKRVQRKRAYVTVVEVKWHRLLVISPVQYLDYYWMLSLESPVHH